MYPLLLWALLGVIGEVHSRCVRVSIAGEEGSIAYVCTDDASLGDLGEVSPSAEWIEFSVTRFQHIPGGAFARFPNLRRLSFYNCHVRLIAPDAFEGLHRLEWLVFHGTKVHALRAAWFRHLANLRRLVLDRCGLVHVEPETFRLVPRLEVLELRDNDLDCLPVDELEYLRALRSVRLDGNPWLCECQRRLDRFFRERGVLQHPYCDPGPKLCTVNYQCMTQIRIPAHALVHRYGPGSFGDSNFETSDIASLNRLPDTATAIDINGVPIDTIPRYSFFRFGNSLRSLSFRDCRLVDIEADAFAGLHKLQRLSLTGNRFASVKANWFRDLVNLQQLDLRGNGIREIEPAAFWHLASSLRELDIRDNELRCIATQQLDELRRLERLNATGNPWSCGCLRDLQRFLVEKNIGFEVSSACYDSETDLAQWQQHHQTRVEEPRTTGEVHWSSFHQFVQRENVTVSRPAYVPPPTARPHVLPVTSPRPEWRPQTPPPSPEFRANCREEKTPHSNRVVYTCSGISSLEELNVIPRSVHTIRVVQSSIGTVSENAFSRFNGYLSRLELRHCGIRKVSPGAFTGLYNLEYLSLHSNQLETVTAPMLSGVSHLRHLDLSRNRVDRITNDVFEALPYLNTLDVSENSMNCIGVEYIAQRLHYLTSFRVAGNPWSCLCGTKLVDFLQRKGLHHDVSADTMAECYATATTGVVPETTTTVVTVTVPSEPTDAPQVEGTCSSQDTPAGPRYECVGGNLLLLETIPDDAVGIEFYEGHLPRLPAGYFSRFRNLQDLEIRNSRLLVIEEHAFDGLDQLRNLSIQDNPLKSIGATIFPLKNLERLDLRGNSINHVAPGAFRHLDHLTHLNLEGNDLKCIFTSDLNDMPEVHSVEFAGNPLKWRCRVELEQFLETRKIKFVRVENSCEGKKLVRNLLLQNQTDLQSLDCSSDCSAAADHRIGHLLLTLIVILPLHVVWR